MPLTKRTLFDLSSYQHLEQFQDLDQQQTLESRTFSKLIGACRQLSYLSSYALEIFQNVTALADDINERVKVVIVKTDNLMNKVAEVEKIVRNTEITPDFSINHATLKLKYMKNRAINIPPLFGKATTCQAIEAQYNVSRAPPQLWRIENLTGTDCFAKYSFPGYFFQEWLRSEILKQEQDKTDRRKRKMVKKQSREEEKRLRQQLAGQRLIAIGKATQPREDIENAPMQPTHRLGMDESSPVSELPAQSEKPVSRPLTLPP